MIAVLGHVSEDTAPVFVRSGVFLSGSFHIDVNVVAYTDQLFDLADDCMAILHRTCCLSTIEVTFEGVATYPVTREPPTVEYLMDTQLSQSRVRMQFLSPVFFNTFQADFFFRGGRERSSHFLQSCRSCHQLGDGVPFGQGPDKLVEKLAGYTAGEPVIVYTEMCNHKVPRVTSPMMQATRLRIVLN